LYIQLPKHVREAHFFTIAFDDMKLTRSSTSKRVEKKSNWHVTGRKSASEAPSADTIF
jgi:hypothetical protein